MKTFKVQYGYDIADYEEVDAKGVSVDNGMLTFHDDKGSAVAMFLTWLFFTTLGTVDTD